MSRLHSYISSATEIIGTYDGSGPLVHHLKAFFSAKKKYGSRDRKMIASLCYSYFRTGHALRSVPVKEKILTGLFLSESKSNDILAALRPEWNEQVSLSVNDKLSMLQLDPVNVFPLTGQLGNEIEAGLFVISFLKQPHLYLRVRPGKIKKVTGELNVAGIQFEIINEYCLQFTNTTSLDDVVKINRDAVIQDYSSQQVLNFYERFPSWLPGKDKVEAWDCCAASGGKSILLFDKLEGNVKLTVSDIRENILVNLGKRLQEAGINIYKKFVTDLSEKASLLPEVTFPLIICDAPCTGSGTWSRTPEQLFYFKEESISIYAAKQKRIVSNIIPHLRAGGLFFYITCSVFKNENEEIVDFIKERFNLTLLQMEYLKGYEKRADTMFVAVFST